MPILADTDETNGFAIPRHKYKTAGKFRDEMLGPSYSEYNGSGPTHD